MPNEVNIVLPQPNLEPKLVAKPKFMPTFHRNAYGQSDLIAAGNVE